MEEIANKQYQIKVIYYQKYDQKPQSPTTHVPTVLDCDTQAKELPVADTSGCAIETTYGDVCHLHDTEGTHHILSEQYDWMVD